MSCENLSIILYLKSSMVISNNPSKNPSEGEFLRLTPTKELMKSPESLGPGRWTVGKNVVAPRYTTQIEHYDNMGAIFVPQKRSVDVGLMEMKCIQTNHLGHAPKPRKKTVRKYSINIFTKGPHISRLYYRDGHLLSSLVHIYLPKWQACRVIQTSPWQRRCREPTTKRKPPRKGCD